MGLARWVRLPGSEGSVTLQNPPEHPASSGQDHVGCTWWGKATSSPSTFSATRKAKVVWKEELAC